ncbi:MAG: ATP synthase F0 subunit C [Planctomycetes bacterium]|nr:ATP synthase F0 subunit C [Planctomycetota bacterium]
MTLASRVLIALATLLIVTPAAPAADPNWAGLGAGISMGLAIIGAGIGLGLIGFSALSGIARQPEQSGKIQGVMYVLAALVEGAAIIALLLCFLVAARIMG